VFNRQSVQRAIKIALGLLKPIKKVPENGIVLFCGRVRSSAGQEEREISEIISPPLPIKTNMYKCDKLFHTEYISHLFKKHKTYGYLVLISDTFYLGKVEGTKQMIVYKFSTEFSTNTRRGGQSSNRFARLRDEQKHNYKIKILETCERYFKNVDGIIIAGNADLPREINEALISAKIYPPILGILKTASSNFDEIIENSISFIKDDEIVKEQAIISEVTEILRKEPDLLVFGEKNLIEADKNFLLRYAVLERDNSYSGKYSNLKLENTPVKKIHFSKFLRDYGGSVGILYYKQLNEDLEEN
jgi:peptide chain release factor subunit 1